MLYCFSVTVFILHIQRWWWWWWWWWRLRSSLWTTEDAAHRRPQPGSS